VRIRIAKAWLPLVLAAILIASAGCAAGRCATTNAGCDAHQESPAGHGCTESGGPNSRCS